MPGRPQYILLPVSPLFIAFSLTCAFMLNLLPWGQWVFRSAC
jgi:rod shape-determining protein MreD